MKKWIMKVAPALASLALASTTANVNSACTWVCYQPKLPENANKLRKF